MAGEVAVPFCFMRERFLWLAGWCRVFPSVAAWVWGPLWLVLSAQPVVVAVFCDQWPWAQLEGCRGLDAQVF